MTPRERLEVSLGHREPDRVPCGEWEPIPRPFTEQILGRRSYLGFINDSRTAQALWEGKRDEVVESMKRDLVDLVLALGWDAAPVFLVPDHDSPRPEKPLETGPGDWRTLWGDELRLSEGRIMWTRPGSHSPAPEDRRDPYPTDSELELIRYVRNRLGETHYLLGWLPAGHPQLVYSRIWGRDEDMVRVYEHPEEWAAAEIENVDRLYPVACEVARAEGIDGIWYGHDLGHSGGTFFPPRIFARSVATVLRRRSDIIHRHGLRHMLHSCGNNREVMDQIVDAGVDVYQSIQPQMPVAELKRSFGERLALWGGVPAELLIDGEQEAIQKASRETLDACAPGGGYVFGTSHSIMPGSDPRCYRLMLRALQEWNDLRAARSAGSSRAWTTSWPHRRRGA